MTVLLETRNVSKSYGVFRALDQVTIAVHEGELVSVVGPNGAGKTTLVNLLTGLLEPTAGEVLFMGKNIAGVGPVALADHGLARAFQLIQIFPQLTVRETIAAAIVSRQKKRWRFCARSASHSARRTDVGCVDIRQARNHEDLDRGCETRRRQGDRAGRARHGPGGGLFAPHHCALRGTGAG
jgi:ABC-type branched-subunit amino acid transport system ATPase component